MESSFQNDERPPNYRERANYLSVFTFWWTSNIFKLGSKRDLYESDLPEPLKEHTASMLGDKIARLWSKEYQHAKIRQVKPSLTKTIVQCFVGEFCCYGMYLAFLELLLKPIQPLFLGLVVRYFTAENGNNTNPEGYPMYFQRIFNYNYPNQSAIKSDEAIIFATCLVAISLISVSIQHPFMLAVMHLGMKIRVACTSLLYRKTLRMSMLALSPTTVGNVMNLMSNDATRFDIVTMFIHYLWISPLQLCIIIYIIHKFAGLASIFGACIIFGFIPIQILLAKYNKSLRWQTAYKTDERVRLMNEIISGIQVIKMYAWEYAFCKLVYNSRRREMRMLVKTSYLRGIVMSMIMFTSRAAIFTTLITMAVVYHLEISSETVFIITGYYIIMRASMTVFFPNGVTQCAETIITIQRTRDYLMNEDAALGDPSILDPRLNDQTPATGIEIETDMHSLSLSHRVDPITSPSIRIVEAYAKWYQRYVIRDVELIMKDGQMVVLIGQVGSGKTSLLHVILKELPVCEGFVSVRGIVSYASQEPWLFQGSVRQNILFGHEYKRERYRKVCKVCALLKDFKLLPYGDQTIIGERGISLSGGQRARVNLARCIYKEADIYVLDDPLSAVDTHVGAQIFNECISRFLNGKIRVLVTHQLQYLQHVDQLIIMEKGRVMATGNYDELKNSGLDFARYMNATTSTDVDKPGNVPQTKSVAISVISGEAFHEEILTRESLLESRGTGRIDCKLYKQYWRAGGNCCWLPTLVLMFLATQAFASGSDFLIGQWVKLEEIASHSDFVNATPPLDTNTLFTKSNDYIISYTVLTGLLIILSITRSFIFFYVCLCASIKLHDDMFDSVIFSRMRFFNINPSGRILNRFSKDMGAVDEDLPFAMIDFFQMLLNLVGVFIVLACTNYCLIIPIFVILFGIYFIRRYYLKTSRSLKRLEGTVRSEVFSHLNASIQGLSTIRSHNAEQILTYEFEKHNDLHSSVWYLFIATARAFSLWIDYLCVTLIMFSSYGGFVLETGFNVTMVAGDIGLCITQCLMLTGLIPWGMRQSAEMENHMTSVERIIDFTNIESEPNLKGSKEPPKNWPQDGEIVFQDLDFRYSRAEEPVLRNINITIQPEEKIGIVGRTGAGKSSIISAIFRLAYQSGSIIIDDVNTADIGLHDLRKRISIIPQEPIIFSGSLRFNLDPFRQFTDETLLSALTVVDLEMGKRDILNKPLTEGGADFSAGQKQLLCLARAIVRNNRILVLDEATANMDARTDFLIQNTIRAKFAHCTVLTIAHRLQTIMDSDRILVMHAGTVVEFDHPHLLLKNEHGIFTGMVKQSGKSNEDYLRKIAEESFGKIKGQLPSDELSNSHTEEEIF